MPFNMPALIAKHDSSWRIYVGLNRLCFATNNPAFPQTKVGYYQSATGEANVNDGQWHCVVAVYKPIGKVARKSLYLDGRLEAENEAAMPRERTKYPVWIGANGERAGREFSGLIDEVAIFSRELSAKEVETMFQAGNPEED
jgi:hypothetical protein